MQTRDYKKSAPGGFFHIYNRGNARENIFLDDEDFAFFLLRLRQNLAPDKSVGRYFRPLPTNSFELIAYCLMPNHFHLLIKQGGDIPTSKLLGKLCTSYAIYFNRKYDRVGHIFQDQFKQIQVDSNKYLTWLSAYIHNNPVMAGLTEHPEDWRWSSYQEYVDSQKKIMPIKSEIVLGQYKSPLEYKEFVESVLLVQHDNISSDLLLDP